MLMEILTARGRGCIIACNELCPEKAKDLRSVRHDSADVPGVAQIQRFRGSTLLDLGILTQPLTKTENG
jgi:hypothetical protein